MPVGQAEEIIALALVFAVHVVGGALLVWALLDDDQRSGWRRRWSRRQPDDPPAPQPVGRRLRASLPLADSAPSRVRLREPVRAADRIRVRRGARRIRTSGPRRPRRPNAGGGSSTSSARTAARTASYAGWAGSRRRTAVPPRPGSATTPRR